MSVERGGGRGDVGGSSKWRSLDAAVSVRFKEPSLTYAAHPFIDDDVRCRRQCVTSPAADDFTVNLSLLVD